MVEWLVTRPECHMTGVELKGERDIMILPAVKDKGTLVMNSSDYKQKLKSLLHDTTVYEDPTTTYKNRLMKILREWKKEGTIS